MIPCKKHDGRIYMPVTEMSEYGLCLVPLVHLLDFYRTLIPALCNTEFGEENFVAEYFGEDSDLPTEVFMTLGGLAVFAPGIGEPDALAHFVESFEAAEENFDELEEIFSEEYEQGVNKGMSNRLEETFAEKKRVFLNTIGKEKHSRKRAFAKVAGQTGKINVANLENMRDLIKKVKENTKISVADMKKILRYIESVESAKRGGQDEC